MAFPMKVWRLTPDQVAAYKLGQDLGDPHEIKMVKTAIERSREDAEKLRARQQRSIKRRMEGKVQLTKPLYDIEVAAGLDDAEIAEKYGLQRSTMYHYKSLWRKAARVR
ncbi:hypothetical protein D3P07_11440 [Paenibacillus sp. 1011MAR3C5]|uniref:hypothetical protein n=1 Tax=Paenibacillus sp. 1011MAR3C5 TaxID=1675787 RepID=UPI000E6C4703|nr:hypothetical protein [Paenibacillus sp. 1011MAR3C5]RJE88601.1 hypothetical protein D3P07_11440 [Paenibacillus sp. 1011MAR3C5]